MLSWLAREDRYDVNNRDHRERIEKQVDALNKSYASLFMADALIVGAPNMASNILWLFGFQGLVSNTVVDLAVAYVAYVLNDRASQAQRFQQDLNNLHETFQWCCLSGPSITNDDTFIHLAKNIAPFVQTRTLCVWGDGVSEKYAAIIAEPPHNQHITEKDDKTAKREGSIFSFFSAIAPGNQLPVNLKQIDYSWSPVKLIQRTKAEAKLYWYGLQNEQEARGWPELKKL